MMNNELNFGAVLVKNDLALGIHHLLALDFPTCLSSFPLELQFRPSLGPRNAHASGLLKLLSELRLAGISDGVHVNLQILNEIP
jgi:hypothetical protein